jgi:hypothetical protein
VKEDLEYHWVASHIIQSQFPPYSGEVQPLTVGSRGQNGWYLTGASRYVKEILSDNKPSYLREVEVAFHYLPHMRENMQPSSF